LNYCFLIINWYPCCALVAGWVERIGLVLMIPCACIGRSGTRKIARKDSSLAYRPTRAWKDAGSIIVPYFVVSMQHQSVNTYCPVESLTGGFGVAVRWHNRPQQLDPDSQCPSPFDSWLLWSDTLVSTESNHGFPLAGCLR
jgi:hypothetical protein